MQNGSERPIVWHEIMLFIIIIVFGTSLWTFVQGQLLIKDLTSKPNTAEIAKRFHVQELTRQLDDSQIQLSNAIELQYSYQEQEDKASAIHSRFVGAYPQLASLSYTQTIELSFSPLLTYSSFSGSIDPQVAANELLNFTISTLISHTLELVTTLQKQEPESYLDNAIQLSEILVQLTHLQLQADSYSSATAQNQIELLRIKQTYPQLTTFILTQQIESIYFDQIVYDYLKNAVSLYDIQKINQQMKERIEKLQNQVAQLADLLAAAKENVDNSVKIEQNSFLWNQRWKSLGWTIGGVLAIILLLNLINLVASDELKVRHPLLVFAGSFTTILILLSFEIAQIWGISVIGLVIFLLILFMLYHYERNQRQLHKGT